MTPNNDPHAEQLAEDVQELRRILECYATLDRHDDEAEAANAAGTVKDAIASQMLDVRDDLVELVYDGTFKRLLDELDRRAGAAPAAPVLTDEEISAAWDAHERRAWDKTLISPPVFARAIESLILSKLQAQAPAAENSSVAGTPAVQAKPVAWRIHASGGPDPDRAGSPWHYSDTPLPSHPGRIVQPLFAAPVAQQAVPQPLVPEGWRLVPKEPTEEMLDASWDATADCTSSDVNAIRRSLWRAMLDAAPIAAPTTSNGEAT